MQDSGGRYYGITHQHLAPGPQRRYESLQDQDRVGIGPVVEDMAEIVNLGAKHGIGVEHIVRLELDTAG